jgi:hypothetical protein
MDAHSQNAEFSALHDLQLNDPTKTPTTSNNGVPVELAIECWDVDDGRLID